MKKKVLSVFLAAAMVASLAVGCGNSGGGGSDSGSGESGGDSSEGVTLDVIISQYGNYTQDWWKEFEKTFEEANDGIDLNIEIVSWNDIYSVVNTRISSNEQPDILNISGFADYVLDDLLMPAEDYVSSDLKANFIPSFWESNGLFRFLHPAVHFSVMLICLRKPELKILRQHGMKCLQLVKQ